MERKEEREGKGVPMHYIVIHISSCKIATLKTNEGTMINGKDKRGKSKINMGSS
jgi:hypothetical protein